MTNVDDRHHLISEADHEVNPGPMNIQFDSSDLRSKRWPFYIEPTNIVSVNDVIQRVSDHASAMNKRIHYYSRLSTPADKALAGFTTGMCVIVLMGLLTLYCCYRVVKSRSMIGSLDTTTWEYPDVCRHYFGSFGQWSSLLCSLVSLIGAMIVYWVLMSNFLFNTGKFIFNFIHHINDTDTILRTNNSSPVICPSAGSGSHPDNDSMIFYTNDTGVQQFEKWWNRSKTVPFYLIGLLLPLLNFKSPSFFSKFNILGKVRDLCIAYMLVTLTYLYIGVLVFASFPSPPLSKDCIEQNFLDNFPSSDILSFIARIFLLFQMMTVYPLLGYLARVQLLGHIFGDIYPSIFHVLILNIIIVGAGVIMAAFYPNIGGIIRYSGAACGLAFVFIYPSLIYIISLHQEERLTWPKLILHIFIIILGLANLIAQFFM
ncbi:Putative sodium-coupled neutral amino acid transporter 9 [Heterocephalus glaber]|uniref:Neutral amino acid transporter 9 n=1 Tax=Heterocephalus glaber TaxID=10181 RepID=G5C4G9_HETGA|nr:Putative sodium-coupled neutral amino acid transporter 9 [Heterocephalus glaber]